MRLTAVSRREDGGHESSGGFWRGRARAYSDGIGLGRGLQWGDGLELQRRTSERGRSALFSPTPWLFTRFSTLWYNPAL